MLLRILTALSSWEQSEILQFSSKHLSIRKVDKCPVYSIYSHTFNCQHKNIKSQKGCTINLFNWSVSFHALSLIQPLGRFSLYIAMSIGVSVCAIGLQLFEKVLCRCGFSASKGFNQKTVLIKIVKTEKARQVTNAG